MERHPAEVSVELRRRRLFDPLRERRSLGGLRSVELNLAGWATLVAAGLAAGGLSALAGTPVAIALPAGIVAAWLVALVLDTVRWRNLKTGIGRSGLDELNGQEIVARLRAMGVEADYEGNVFIEPDGTLFEQRTIWCRNADYKKVDTVMREVLDPQRNDP